MPIVNFNIPKALDKRINALIKKKGFGSKAEFFRFASIYFIDIVDKPTMSEDERFEYITKALESEIVTQYKGKKILSAEDQLADLS